MQTIHISDKILLHLRQAAALRGLDTDAYAEELLAKGLGEIAGSDTSEKPYHAMQFSGIAPTDRSATDSDC